MDYSTFKTNLTFANLKAGIYRHIQSILIGMLVLLVALMASGIFLELRSKKTQQIYGELYRAQTQLKRAGEAANQTGYRDRRNRLLNKKYIYSDEMKSIASNYETQIKSHKGTKAGAVFAIDLADFFNLYKEHERAISLLSLFAFAQKKSHIYHLVSFKLASAYMDSKDCKKALKIWSALIQNKQARFFHREAQVQSAICYEEQQNYKMAKEIYSKILKDNGGDIDQKIIRDYQYLLTLKQKLK